MLRAEAGASCSLIDRGGNRTFDGRCGRQVFDPAAVRAHEMVVVLGEIFGELVAREAVARRHPAHDACLFEHDEIPVQRALREAAALGENFGNRKWAGCRREHVDDAGTNRREALRVCMQHASDSVVQRRRRTGGHASKCTG